MRSLRDESGQALVVVALGLTSLLGFIGLAVDVGSLMHNKRELQVAADAAAIAAAMSRNATGYAAAGQNASAANGFANGGTVTVTINPTPISGEYLGQPGYYEAIIQKTEPTIFMGLFGHGSVPVGARAVAVAQSSNGANTGCVYTLGATGQDFSITGNSNVQAPQCGINVDSSSNNAMSLTGNVTLDAASIGIVGGLSKTGNVSLTPSSPTTGTIPYSDPLSYLPGYSCTASSCTPSGGGSNIPCQAARSITGNQTVTLSPGCYDGLSFGGNSNATLSPGTYIINGSAGLSFSGNNNVSGTGVTIYIANGSLSMVGNTVLDLSAPTSGTYAGVLFDQSPSDTSAASLVGNSGSDIEGVMYFPTASFTLTGNSGTSIYTDFVVSSLSLVGNASFQDYAALGGSVTSPLTVVTLVE
jgi:Putative Flp pilus-assembly TadE/G-like